MAKILAIESTGSVCGVCLFEDKNIIGEYYYEGSNIHDQMLADSVRKILPDNGIPEIKFLDAVAVSAGPGSFTGIRIGSGIAKGLCFGNEPKFIAVHTLKAMAKSLLERIDRNEFDFIVPVITSVNNTCFYSRYDKKLQEQTAPELINLHELPSKLSKNDVLCGNVTTISELSIQNEFYQIELSAKNIAILGIEMYKQGLFTNPEEFKPIYAQEFIPKFKVKTHKI